MLSAGFKVPTAKIRMAVSVLLCWLARVSSDRLHVYLSRVGEGGRYFRLETDIVPPTFGGWGMMMLSRRSPTTCNLDLWEKEKEKKRRHESLRLINCLTVKFVVLFQRDFPNIPNQVLGS